LTSGSKLKVRRSLLRRTFRFASQLNKGGIVA
jgi:hypothetical protein